MQVMQQKKRKASVHHEKEGDQSKIHWGQAQLEVMDRGV